MHLEKPRATLLLTWLGKGFVRFLLVLIAAAAVAAFAAGFGIAHDYGYLHASILTGSPDGQYHARLGTLVVANPCAKRADRVALLMLLTAELPGFLRANPPGSTSSATVLPLAPSAHQFFLTGEPEIADRYFPWLVNLMSPAYWVYLFMAVTVLFNGMKVYSRFRLWRIDATREKLATDIKQLVDPKLTHAQIRAAPSGIVMADADKQSTAQSIMERLVELRARCQRHTNSFVTPMGDEMFYRYQQSLIDEASTTVGALLQHSKAQQHPNRIN